MKKDRSRDKIEAMKYNLSLSLSFLPVIHDTRGGSANRVDHVRRNHYHWSSSLSLLSSHSLSSRPSTRIELSANCHRGDLAGVKSWTLVYDRSFGIVISLSLSLSLPSFSSRRFRSLLDLGRSKRAMRMIIFARIKIL